MRIIFMGTPAYAAEVLDALARKEDVTVSAVVTRPDKPKGRGMKLVPCPVKELALSLGIPVYQPKTLRDGAFQAVLDEYEPELIVVAAYGNILPSYVLDYPKYGCVNAHGSLLPKYRGASPIQRAIMDGESVTGITAMMMDEGIDTGDILGTYPCAIEEDDDCGTLTGKLAKIAAAAMCGVIDMIREGTLTPTPQPEEGACYAAKIGREDAALDFDAPARSVFNRIRALNPSPCAVVKLPNGDPLKITASKAASAEECEKALGQFPGTVVLAEGRGEGRIVVACREGAVALTGVIPAGRKPMSAGDFVRGRKIAAGDILTVMKEE